MADLNFAKKYVETQSLNYLSLAWRKLKKKKPENTEHSMHYDGRKSRNLYQFVS